MSSASLSTSLTTSLDGGVGGAALSVEEAIEEDIRYLYHVHFLSSSFPPSPSTTTSSSSSSTVSSPFYLPPESDPKASVSTLELLLKVLHNDPNFVSTSYSKVRRFSDNRPIGGSIDVTVDADSDFVLLDDQAIFDDYRPTKT